MAIKQPRVPEYQEGEGAEEYIGSLILFLKDFCQEVWLESGQARKKIAGIRYPVTSVNGKTGEVSLGAQDVGARAADWTPSATEVGALPGDGTAVNSVKFNGKAWKDMLLELYPVGAIYVSASATSPASLFGGTWEEMKDRFLLGAGGTYQAGSTGGAATVTLTTSQIPSHRHPIALYNASWNNATHENLLKGVSNAAQYGSYSSTGGPQFRKAASDQTYTGGGGSHDNMPPYLAVYMWKRVS